MAAVLLVAVCAAWQRWRPTRYGAGVGCTEHSALTLTRTHSRSTRAHSHRDTISEGLEGKQADLFEEMGVDSDEAAGVDYAQVADLLPKGGGGGAAGRAAGVKRPRG